MPKRSLKASPEGIREAKKAFTQKGWTQDYLAFEVNLKTRQPIWRFFTGQPVDRFIFVEICFVLGVEWREIAENPPAESIKSSIESQKLLTIDVLVKQVRWQRLEKIQAQCGTLRLLDIGHPVKIDDVYIDVNILKASPCREWLESKNLQSMSPEEFKRFGQSQESEKLFNATRAVETYSKLRVLGQLGSGKTTFLRHLALECNRGKFLPNHVPIFITLRDFAQESRYLGELSLLKYLSSEFLTSGISEPSVMENLLFEGRVLLLLDGFDELLNADSKAVFNEIRRFSEKYHNNFFVITCRTAQAKTFTLNCFTDVEIAPLTSEQILATASKWFGTFTKNKAQDVQKEAVKFIEKFELLEDMASHELLTTPLFLQVACSVFTVLEKFPMAKTEFYKRCLELLLFKWDESKGLRRNEVYQDFFWPQKLKLLSHIAAKMFEKGHYFFKQQLLEQYIRDYLQDLPNTFTEPYELPFYSENVVEGLKLGLLKERVQGIFSFSYLALQQYLTAKKIVSCANLSELEKSLKNLVSHLSEPRWRKIFLLIATMLRSADPLIELLKQEIDALVAQDSYLQEFLVYARQKSLAISLQPKRLNNRAIYLAPTPLTTILAQQRLLQHDWHLSTEQQQVLKQYYESNQLLLDCLSNSEVTSAVQQEIEFTFLLPPQKLTTIFSS